MARIEWAGVEQSRTIPVSRQKGLGFPDEDVCYFHVASAVPPHFHDSYIQDGFNRDGHDEMCLVEVEGDDDEVAAHFIDDTSAPRDYPSKAHLGPLVEGQNGAKRIRLLEVFKRPLP